MSSQPTRSELAKIIWSQQNLIRRAYKLLRPDDEGLAEDWDKRRDEWMDDIWWLVDEDTCSTK